MSEVTDTLECPSRLLTTTMFWSVYSATLAWKWRRLRTDIPSHPTRRPYLLTVE